MDTRFTLRSDWYNLSWLPPITPEEFSANCKLLPFESATTLRTISSFRLTEGQLTKLSGLCADIQTPPLGFEPFRLAILSDSNCSFLLHSLRASALRYGLWLDIHLESMGRILSAALDPTSILYTTKIDAVLIAYSYHAFTTDNTGTNIGDIESARRTVDQFVSTVTRVRDLARERLGARTIVQTIPHCPHSVLGNLELRVDGTLNSLLKSFNREILSSDCDVIDIERLANIIGLSTWDDVRYWHWAKLPFALNLIPVYADYVSRYLGVLRGRTRKCLVLDLDNTLWGGTIGDEGLEGIKLGHGTALGEAYLAVQKMALDLQRRGVVLAVCSKNDDTTARLPFREHREMVLREEHIAVFQADWNDKATNLETVATTLSLSPDALVFLDDNPAERQIVRRELPSVAVPEIPDTEPAIWPLIVSAAGYFDTLQFTGNDLRRAQQYADNARRAALMVNSRDLRSYLRELEMNMEISSFTASQRSRIAQLINRANQFNLTTRRYTDEQLASMEANPAFACIAVRLEDRFGDNGIISVVICNERDQDWYIDTWLMSCRVLGRQVELAVLNYLVEEALQAGKARLLGHYIPTSKNRLVELHYEKLGFTLLSRDHNDSTTWALTLNGFEPIDVPLRAYRRTAAPQAS